MTGFNGKVLTIIERYRSDMPGEYKAKIVNLAKSNMADAILEVLEQHKVPLVVDLSIVETKESPEFHFPQYHQDAVKMTATITTAPRVVNITRSFEGTSFKYWFGGCAKYLLWRIGRVFEELA